MRLPKKYGFVLLAAAATVAMPPASHAYRPFDSTDPAVAEPGEVEIELSPLSFRWDDAGRTWIAPQLRFNYGFAPNWEFVAEGEGEHPRSPGARSTLVGHAVFLQGVIREGTLQERPGASVATEFGVLLPGVNEESGLGAEWAGIIGTEESWGAVHFNVATSLTRDQRAGLLLGTILEGPGDWIVRPVAELLYEREFGTAEMYAALVGVIWQVRDTFAFDLAVRRASIDGEPETELRMGLTFAFSIR